MNNLDRYDLLILDEIQKTANLTNIDLADRVGLPVITCSKKVKQLFQLGLIVKKVAILDKKKLGLNLIVNLYVLLDRLTADRISEFQTAVSQSPFVLECQHVTGLSYDYHLKLALQDLDHYHAFVTNTMAPVAGIKKIHTSFVLRTIMDRTEVPLSSLTACSTSYRYVD